MNVNWRFVNLITKRFVKVFVIGGLASLSTAIIAQPLYFSEWNTWASSLVVAFLAGGFAALEKWTQGFNPPT